MKKISLKKEEQRVNALFKKVEKWYGNDESLDYLKRTGAIYNNGKKYTLTEEEHLVALYGRENAEDILKSRLHYKK